MISPPIVCLSVLASLSLFLVLNTAASPGSPSDILRGLVQVIATMLGVNILGLTINTNQFGQSSAIRKLILEIEECAEGIYPKYFTAHSRDQKLMRTSAVRAIIAITPIQILILRNEQKPEDYYVYRPHWDGVWYQLGLSPFAKHVPEAERAAIGLLHEATLCAIRLLRHVREMKDRGCALLSEDNGTNGTRWFLEDLREVEKAIEWGTPDSSPVTIRADFAARLINAAIKSSYYMQEEFREHCNNPDWEPHRLTHFACFFVEHSIWMGFLWGKLQLMRLANINTRLEKHQEKIPQKTRERIGLDAVASAQEKFLALSKETNAEYGVANRFWQIRQAAVPGLGWAMLFLLLAFVLWPATIQLVSGRAQSVVLSIIYGIGAAALLESFVFAYGLVWRRSVGPAFSGLGSRPPS
jgi:hypothetical protein